MREKVTYSVVTYSQVLYSGTWEDGNWDWELNDVIETGNLEYALKCINDITICDDLPLARLYKETIYWDGDDYETSEELLIERS